MKLTFDRRLAQRKLDEARKSKKTIWPEIGFVAEVHPVIDWLVDKVLIKLGRQQAPVLQAAVDDPVSLPAFLVQGVYCNRLGQPTVVEWMAITGLPDAATVRPMPDVLASAGVRPTMPNPTRPASFDTLQPLVPAAIETARDHMARCLARRLAEWDEHMSQPLRTHRQRVEQWEQKSLVHDGTPAHLRAKRDRRVRATAAEQRDVVHLLETTGEPLLRLLAVLDGGPR